MKTLDEVIENLSVKQSLKDLGYRPDPDEIADALYYLREYRTLQHGYIKAMADIDDNSPLTWDELKQMRGKPVWVVEEGYQTWKYWSLVYWMKDDELTLLNENGQTTYSKNEQGTVWQAYRKERK